VHALGLQPGAYLLVVARLVPENNVELLLDAIELMSRDVRTVVVGSAAGRSPIEERLGELQDKGESLTWLGHVADQHLLAQLWRHAGLYVHGHSVGGTNPALLQALGLGAPTIALDTVYNREVLGDDWPLYPAGTPVELAQLIESLLEDAPAKRALRERGQSIIGDRYTWDRVLHDYTETLNRVAARS
jgi:glycosyltransferase involved in cell wall biosynthesis